MSRAQTTTALIVLCATLASCDLSPPEAPGRSNLDRERVEAGYAAVCTSAGRFGCYSWVWVCPAGVICEPFPSRLDVPEL